MKSEGNRFLHKGKIAIKSKFFEVVQPVFAHLGHTLALVVKQFSQTEWPQGYTQENESPHRIVQDIEGTGENGEK